MITSTKNRQVIKTARLKKRAIRERERRFLVESAQVALEALEAGAVELLYHVPEGDGEPVVQRARDAGVRTQEVSEQVMAHLTSTVTPQGMVGVAGFVDVAIGEIPADAMLVPVLCSVRDPGNAGTILRSADAAGADAVVFTATSVDVYNPKTVRASAGSLFHVPVVRSLASDEAVAELRARGMEVLAAAADGEESIYEADLSRPMAVLFGNEAWGLDAEVRELADRSVRVPIRGRAESLNLAVAAALVMFEAARARQGARRGEGSVERIAALVGAAAHDARSPLGALTGFVGALARNWERLGETKRQEILEEMLLDGERVSGLVRLVVDAVRVEAGALPTGAGERADVEEASRWVEHLFRRSEDLPEVRIEGSGEALVDPDRLRTMILALCDGVMWWSSKGPIGIRITPAEGVVEVELRRGGRGPSAEESAAMFEEPTSGGRAGLYAVHRLATALGGSLACEGGDGVRFRLLLPA